MNAERAEHTVASGAWKGGLMEEMIEGVKTSTLGDGVSVTVLSLSPSLLGVEGGGGGGARRDVRSGRKAWIVRTGCSRCVLKRSAKLEGGIVAIGEV